MIKKLGYILFSFSILCFLLLLVVPLTGFSGGKIAGLATFLFIAGEVLFYVSIFILGKSFYQKIKSKLRFWKVRTDNTPGKD